VCVCVCVIIKILQPDMWGVVPSDRHDWAKLREDIAKYVMVLMCSLFVAVNLCMY